MSDPLAWPLGVSLVGDRARVLLWAPHARRVELLFEQSPRRESGDFQRSHRRKSGDPMLPQGALNMQPLDRGYHAVEVPGLASGDRYAFSLDGSEPLPDPASRWQPDGPHAPSAVAPPHSPAVAPWTNPPLGRYVIYELHIGTFTPEGTFDSAAARLPQLADFGITAVEVMPIAQFPGARNWGYDGVNLFAAQSTYGGPAAFRRFVDAAHAAGLAVVLDVVYNHVGPEGNHLPRFGPYFTDRHKTPWGPALNFDQEGSREVRRFFVENALYWTRGLGVDALRLDAVHAIKDDSPTHILTEIADAVRGVPAAGGRVPPIGGFATTGAHESHAYIIAESSDNDPRLTTPRDQGGIGADAQWNDDFHHALRTLLTGENTGYYKDFGTLAHLETALTRGFVRTGGAGASGSAAIPAGRLVAFSQNHDHAGNQPLGKRLNSIVTPAQARLAAAATILSPFIPLLFMGEEYAETAPFLYFVSHTDRALIDAVRTGRAAEFEGFFAHSAQPPPDPQSESTFTRSRLDHNLKHQPAHAQRLALYRELLRLRRETPALARLTNLGLSVARDDAAHILVLRRPGPPGEEGDVLIVMNFGADTAAALPPGPWRAAFCSEDQQWGGHSNPPASTPDSRAVLPAWSATLFTRDHA